MSFMHFVVINIYFANFSTLGTHSQDEHSHEIYQNNKLLAITRTIVFNKCLFMVTFLVTLFIQNYAHPSIIYIYINIRPGIGRRNICPGNTLE